MEKTQVNPWTWQDRLGFSQAWTVTGGQTIVFLSGQVPISPDGQVVGEGDFAAQARQSLANLRDVLAQCGASFADVVKLTLYLTDMTKLPEFRAVKAEFISGPQPASTAVGVAALALPGLMIEVEATAVI